MAGSFLTDCEILRILCGSGTDQSSVRIERVSDWCKKFLRKKMWC